MALVLSNTHLLIGELKESGFTEKQAEAITNVVQKIDLSDLVTKKDFELGLERTKNTLIMWMIGLFVAGAALLMAILQLTG